MQVRSIFRCAFSIAVFILLAGPLFAARDWPGFRGPNYDGSAVDGKFAATPGELAVVWRAPGGPGYSGITITGNHVLHSFSDGVNDVISALDAATGKEIWRTAVVPTYKGHDGSHDGPIATPVVSNDRVFSLYPRGELVAFDILTGKILWKVDLVQNYGAKKPHYGFAASPVVTGGVLVVELGGEKGKALAGFDAKTGKLKWSIGDDVVNYQSPVIMRLANRELILAVSDKKLFLVNPADGRLEMEYEHGGDDAAGAMVPIPIDQDRVLLRNKTDSADLIRFVVRDGKTAVEKIWTAGVFKNTLSMPVYYKGHFYGFTGRIFTAVDATTGEIKWRTRNVADGFLLLVDGNLVIQAKSGSIQVGPADPKEWREIARTDAFKEISWTPPSFAGGALYSRSHKELARLDWRPKASVTSPAAVSAFVPASTTFGKFVAEVSATSDKQSAVDHFFAGKSFSLVEWPDRVTFVYRGTESDIAIAGDLQGSQKEEPMHRIPGTDVYYYSTRLEPDARINYRFVKNYEELIADPLNPRTAKDRRGNPLSWIGMPAWQEPAHLKEAPASKRGTIETHELKSKSRETASIKIDVYLPAGYNEGGARYPVVYYFDGALARNDGLITNTLDNVLGTSVQPLIAVLIADIKTGPEPLPTELEERQAIVSLVTKELIPFVDSRYRTRTESASRAIVGSLYSGIDALNAAFAHPEIFGGVAVQSSWLQSSAEGPLREMIRTAEEQPMRIYIDWGGLYDGRSYSEGWDIGGVNRDFHKFLRERGYRPAGGETHDSYGWASWRNRTDRLLAALFPATETGL